MGGQGLLLLMEFKFLIMMTRPQNITVVGNSNVLWLGYHYQKFIFHQQQEALAAHFDFTSFSARPFFRFLAATFLHHGGVLFGICYYKLRVVFGIRWHLIKMLAQEKLCQDIAFDNSTVYT